MICSDFGTNINTYFLPNICKAVTYDACIYDEVNKSCKAPLINYTSCLDVNNVNGNKKTCLMKTLVSC